MISHSERPLLLGNEMSEMFTEYKILSRSSFDLYRSKNQLEPITPLRNKDRSNIP